MYVIVEVCLGISRNCWKSYPNFEKIQVTICVCAHMCVCVHVWMYMCVRVHVCVTSDVLL